MSIQSRWARLRRRITGKRRIVWRADGRVEFDQDTGKIVAAQFGELGMMTWPEMRAAFEEADRNSREWARRRR